jgi:hypothetical protein
VVRSERKTLLAAWKRVGTDLLAKYGNIATEEGKRIGEGRIGTVQVPLPLITRAEK